jgi:hypothetical protein
VLRGAGQPRVERSQRSHDALTYNDIVHRGRFSGAGVANTFAFHKLEVSNSYDRDAGSRTPIAESYAAVRFAHSIPI